MRIQLKLSVEEVNTIKRYFTVFGADPIKMQDTLSVSCKKTTDDFELIYAPAILEATDAKELTTSVNIYISKNMLSSFLDIGKPVVPFAKSIVGMLTSLKDLYVEKCQDFERQYLNPIDAAKKVGE